MADGQVSQVREPSSAASSDAACSGGAWHHARAATERMGGSSPCR